MMLLPTSPVRNDDGPRQQGALRLASAVEALSEVLSNQTHRSLGVGRVRRANAPSAQISQPALSGQRGSGRPAMIFCFHFTQIESASSKCGSAPKAGPRIMLPSCRSCVESLPGQSCRLASKRDPTIFQCNSLKLHDNIGPERVPIGADGDPLITDFPLFKQLLGWPTGRVPFRRLFTGFRDTDSVTGVQPLPDPRSHRSGRRAH